MSHPTIRPLQPVDLLVGRGQNKIELFLCPDGLSNQERGPTWTTFLPWGASSCGLVYETATHGSAQVYACSRPRRDKWDVVYLANSMNVDDESIENVWRVLLERLCQEAGRRGALRVFARLQDNMTVTDSFRRAGFVVYSHDMLWQREPGTPETRPPLAPISATLRPQRGSDAWGLHSLYRALAPVLTQQSEGLTSRDWRPPSRRWFGNGPHAYVLVMSGEVKGCLHVGKRPRETRLRLLAHPDAHEAVRVLLLAGLPELGVDQAQPVTFLIPEYSAWATGILEQAGFRHVGTQALLVKNTVAWVRAAEPRRRPVVKEVLEPASTVPAAPAAANGDRL